MYDLYKTSYEFIKVIIKYIICEIERFVNIDMNNEFVNRLISVRKAYGKSGYGFAKLLNIPQPSYLRYETGEQKPSARLLIALNRYCNVNINWMLTGQGERFLPNHSLKYESLAKNQNQALQDSANNWFSRLEEVLKENDIDLDYFETITGIPKKHIDNFKYNKAMPSVEDLTLIKSNFNVSIDWLLYGDEIGDGTLNNSNSLLTSEELEAFKSIINKLNQSYLSTFSKDVDKLKI